VRYAAPRIREALGIEPEHVCNKWCCREWAVR
jgi:hypothetical protein